MYFFSTKSFITLRIIKTSFVFSWEEERAKYLEDLGNKLIKTEFKQLIKSEEMLNLHVFVEDVYETRIGPNDANLSMLEMMKGIEEKYRNELFLLDKVHISNIPYC